jgi:hypothetical protein
MIKMDKKRMIGILAIVGIATAFAVYGGAYVGNLVATGGSSLGDIGQPVKYGSMVCAFKNGELVGCHHNALTDVGKIHVTNRLINGASAATSYIAVGNCSGATCAGASSQILPQEINASTGCPNFNAYNDVTPITNATKGLWIWSALWTADCSNLVVNETGIYNGSSARTLFAAANFTSPVTLQTNDQLNVTWVVYVA